MKRQAESLKELLFVPLSLKGPTIKAYNSKNMKRYISIKIDNMNKLLMSMLLGLTILACNENPKSKGDTRFREDFYKKIDKVGSYCPKQAVDNEFIILSTYLYMITGRLPMSDIKTQSCLLNNPDSVFYPQMAHLKDKQFWYEWYNEHRHEVDYQFADSVYQVIKQKVQSDAQKKIVNTSGEDEEEEDDKDRNCLLGAYGIDELGNAWLAIEEDSIYYPDSDLRYKYILKGDTIQIMKEEGSVENIVIKELTREHLIIYYPFYEMTDTLVRRGPETGNEGHEANQSKALFDKFLSRFSADSLFQLQRIHFPLETKSIDIEEEIEIAFLLPKQWKHLDLNYNPQYAKREVDAYEQYIKLFSNSGIVSIKGIDNGIWMDYVFERKKDDWVLIKFIDYSN